MRFTSRGRRAVAVLVTAILALGVASMPTSADEPSGAARAGVKVGAFTFDLDDAEGTATLTGWSGSRKKKITIPATITSRGTSYRVTSIGYGAFAGPVSFVYPDHSPKPATSVSIPRGVETIEDFAFYGNKIRSFVIPATVTWIGASALDQDRSTEDGSDTPLRKVTFRGDAPRMGELGSYGCGPGGCGYNGLAPFGSGNGLIVYYRPGAAGFTSPVWAGYLAAPVGSRGVPTGYGRHVRELYIHVDQKSLLPGAKAKARLRAWVGGKLSPRPKKLTFRWELQRVNGTWRYLGSGKKKRLPKNSAGRMLRVVAVAKGPGTREAVLQLKGVYQVKKEFATTPRPTIELPDGVSRATVGTRLTAVAARAKDWSPRADTVRYRWYRNGKAITTKGSKRVYVVTKADRGKRLTVRVTATKQDYAPVNRTSAALLVP